MISDLPVPVPTFLKPAQSPQEVAAAVELVLLVGLMGLFGWER